MRGLPDPTSRLLVSDDARHRLGGAVPSPAAAFLLALIALPTLFWLVILKRTTTYLVPEEWLMANVVKPFHDWVATNLPPLEALLTGISGLGSGWFVALAFSGLGLLALVKGRRDLAIILAAGMLAFPIEWALKYLTAIRKMASASSRARSSTSTASGSTTSPTSRPGMRCAPPRSTAWPPSASPT